MSNVLVVYWSGTGNTQAMAEAVTRGIEQAGAKADLFAVGDTDIAAIQNYSKIAFGCPSMGDEVLEEYEFEPYFASAEGLLAGKTIALFGSYGWGDGGWMREWQQRVQNSGAILVEEGLITLSAPDGEVLERCRDLGSKLARS